MAYQSLYRRYRPQRFDEVKGQDHVTRTLRNAVRDGRVSHAYLFSGPRGTGKTSTARILAKALNCAKVVDGEPCGICESCVAITDGRSLDVVEMDAASNRGIDAIRELIARVSLASPGRWKVYIVDEVHMLTADAANALLKTLESPPPHVVFVLATTELQKVLPTVYSRTQPFEFRLLPSALLADHLRWVSQDAGLDVAPEAIELVARRGSGSARDALSALDQVAAAGGIEQEGPGADELVEALCERDVGAALVAVAERCSAGYDPRQLTRELLEQLRQAFLATIDRNLVGLPDEDLERVEGQGRRLGRPAAVRAMELLGQSLVDMREAPDPRVLLEVALVRLCRPELDSSPEALVERIDRLERALAGAQRGTTAPSSAPPASSTPAPVASPGPTAAARKALGGVRAAGTRTTPARPPTPVRPAATPEATAPEATAPVGPASPSAAPAGPPRAPAAASAAPSAGSSQPFPSREELTLAWGDHVIGRLPQRARARFRVGRFSGVDGETAVFALPDQFHRDRCVDCQPEVEQALTEHFGRPIRLKLVVDGVAGAAARDASAAPPPDDEPVAWEDLTDAPPGAVASPLDHVMQAFEGAEVVEE